ncbi:hypothetical protein ACIP2X_37885 [Streptomyces sp. NPDC089424]|uniref:hypothetical protein n=1 Tax=Streptomyces sp. NPDC089424 TaxID=3365917 RepID=UPI0037FA3F96
MAKLAKAVFVRDPDRHRTVLLHAGEEPEPRLAALVTNPDAWEDGQLPKAVKEEEGKSDAGDSGNDTPLSDNDDDADKPAAPAAKKTAARKTAASNRSRGRDAADEGTSGD